MPKGRVFISYAKADAKKADRIAVCLEERGIDCWIAPRDVKPGAAYGDEIIRGIETSSAFILVLSNASNESDFVAREVERAISKKKPASPFASRMSSRHAHFNCSSRARNGSMFSLESSRPTWIGWPRVSPRKPPRRLLKG